MQQQGAVIVKHYSELAFMGFVEVVKNIRTIFRNIEFCKQDILNHKPDVLILIDYPGFNLRIAEWAHQQKIKVIYYISPQVWAWKQSRVHKIKRVVDKMLVILPFEKAFYKKFGIEVEFVGHPLIDAIENYKANANPDFIKEESLGSKPIIAVLPGSRNQEIAVKLPLMLSVEKDFSKYQFVIAGAPSIPDEFYHALMKGSDAKIVYNKTYDLLNNATAALVTSGTATLETALFGVPEVVCYKGSAVSFFIAKRLVDIEFISLVNLIMNREVVKELIQHELNYKNIKTELFKITEDTLHLQNLHADYAVLKQILGNKGASDKAAEIIFDFLILKGMN